MWWSGILLGALLFIAFFIINSKITQLLKIRRLNKMKWFLLVNFGDYGVSFEELNNETEANNELIIAKSNNILGYNEGYALIKGEVIFAKGMYHITSMIK